MMYDFFYQNGSDHPNCLDNINAALGTQRTIIHPINLFMNTRIASDGKITINRPIPEAYSLYFTIPIITVNNGKTRTP